MSEYRPGYIEGKRKLGVYVDEEVHKALRVRAAETGESMGDITERALRREFGMMQTDLIHWTNLVILDEDGATELNVSDEDKRAYLDEFRSTGGMSGVFFAPLGLPHEDDEDASTWGPESPEAVDWTGFEE